MAETLRDTLKPFLQTIGVDDKKLTSLFNDEGTELTGEATKTLLQHDATRVQKFKTDALTSEQKAVADAVLKANTDGIGKIEADLKAKYNVTSDKTGLELIDEIVATKANVTLDAEKIKVSAEYLKMEAELNKKIKEAEKTWEAKYNDREKSIAKDQMMKSVLAKARAIVTEMKPILPADAKKAEKQMELLINDLMKYEYVDLEGDYSPLENGKPKEDAHGAKVTFENLVKSHAGGIWDFENGEHKSTPAATNDTEVTIDGKKLIVKTPKTEAEYMQAIKEAGTNKELTSAIDSAYTKHLESSKTAV